MLQTVASSFLYDPTRLCSIMEVNFPEHENSLPLSLYTTTVMANINAPLS
jgi:hypothetical protein